MNGKTCFAGDEATDLRIFDGITRRQAYRQAWEAAGVAGHLWEGKKLMPSENLGI